MTKKSWIILGSTIGGVVVCASVLTPILLVPNIYKVNYIRSFVQKYTPVRSMDAYNQIDKSEPSGKLTFFACIYSSILYQSDSDFHYCDVKTNGLHNSLSWKTTYTNDSNGSEGYFWTKISYSNGKITKFINYPSPSMQFSYEYVILNKQLTFHRFYWETNYLPTIVWKDSEQLESVEFICPIWGDDGNIVWDFDHSEI